MPPRPAEDVTGVLAQAFAGLPVREGHDVRAHARPVEALEHRIGACADFLGGLGVGELVGEQRQQPREA